MLDRFLKKFKPVEKPEAAEAPPSAPAPAPGPERRRAVRHVINMEVHIASERFRRGEPFDGETMDISESGLRLKTFDITKKESFALLAGNRRVALGLVHPTLTEPLHLYAIVVWMDFHASTKNTPAICLIGLNFDRVPESTRVGLEALLSRAIKSDDSL